MNVKDKAIILIIDSENTRRREMAKAFKKLASVQFAYRRESDNKLITKPESGIELKPALLALIHFGDCELLKNVDAKIKIYYGGNGGNDKRKPDAEEKIWRPIISNQGVLTQNEAKELIDYANSKFSDSKIVKKPTLLKIMLFLEYLPALAILCQGYLVAGIAANKINVNEIKDDEIKALSSLKRIPQGESPGIRDRWQEVIKAEWWKIFSDIKDLKLRLEKELNKVLEEGENLTKLVDHIINKEAVEDYRIVKNAYFTILKALVGEK